MRVSVLRPLIISALLLAVPAFAAAQEYQVEEVPSAVEVDPARLKPRSVVFSDHRKDELADPVSGLISFEDWARARPVQKQLLSLYPSYAEPTINVSVNGLTKPYKEKLHVYVAEARFLIDRPPGSTDVSRFARLDVIEAIDPSIKHRRISPADAEPYTDPESAHNRHPERRWCEAPGSLCIASRYQLEGKLPLGIRLANKLEDSGKKIAEFVEFQSEVRTLSGPEAAQAGFGKLTGLATPVAGVLEQNLFHVNQMMQFGKFLAVLQNHPSDAAKSVATVFVALAVETDVLAKKKEYEKVPVLRNLVPAQVLMGQSSFNTGNSISAGLPEYARNRIRAVAALLAKP
jgi:hypothetical protein